MAVTVVAHLADPCEEVLEIEEIAQEDFLEYGFIRNLIKCT